MAVSLADILASLDNGVRAINNLSVEVSNSLTNIPISLAALSTDVYAVGAWTPTLTFATPGDLAVTYGNRLGNYTMIGRLIHAQFEITTSVFTFTTSSGSFQVTGLPFTNNASFQGSGSIATFSGMTAFAAGHSYVFPRVRASTAIIELVEMGTTTATVPNSTGSFTSGTQITFRGYVEYTTSVST